MKRDCETQTLIYFSASCPLGELKGQIYSNSDKTCEAITGADCYNSVALTACCQTCPTFRDESLGSSCLYGDKNSQWSVNRLHISYVAELPHC